MGITTWIIIVLVAGGGSFAAGRLTAPKPVVEDNSGEVAQALAANTEALKGVAEATSRPITLDAETRQALASASPRRRRRPIPTSAGRIAPASAADRADERGLIEIVNGALLSRHDQARRLRPRRRPRPSRRRPGPGLRPVS